MMSALVSTRRDVLIGSAAATALLLSPTKRAWSDALPVRPDIASNAGKTMVDLYAAAVKAMQDPAINYPPQPQSWTFQAYIHAVPLNPFDPAVSGGAYGAALKQRIDAIYGNPARGTPLANWKQAALQCWATCTHGSPYFTTWHRWYLHYFERICRKMCKHPEFMLPYWNYASDAGPSLQLPEQFQQPSQDPRNPNHLYFDDRGVGFADAQAAGAQNVPMNAGGFMPFSFSQYGPALGAKDMFPSDDSNHISGDPTDPVYLGLGFTGRLECVPHDNVHGNVGGWMQNVPSSAGDPIFFVHHCQIDRLYASWEAEPGVSYNWGVSDTEPDENTWKRTKTGAFVDENGRLVTVKLGDAIGIASLHYGYDALAAPPAPAVAAAAPRAPLTSLPVRRLTLAAMATKGFGVQSGGTSVTLTPEPKAEAAQPEGTANESRTLVLEGVKLLRRPPAPLSVFINLPKGTPPRLNSPYYVGTLNLFNFDLATVVMMNHADNSNHADHAMPGPTVRFDVTKVLQRQLAERLWDGGDVTLTISTIGADTPAAITYVTVDSASITP